MAEVKLEQDTGPWENAQLMKLVQIKHEPEPLHIKEDPELYNKQELEEFPIDVANVKTDNENESIEIDQRQTEENFVQTAGGGDGEGGGSSSIRRSNRLTQHHSYTEEHTDSSEDTDHSEDYVQPARAKRNYATILPHTQMKKHRPFSCSDCGEKLRSKAALQRHKSAHTEEMPHKCFVCEMAFKESVVLKKHLIWSHLICPVCKKHFLDKLELNMHLRMHVETGTLDKLCLKPSCEYESSLETCMLIHKGLTSHKCPVCEETWRHKNDLNLHLKKQHGLMLSKDKTSVIKMPASKTACKSHNCSDCGKKFRCMSDLQRHTSVHTGEKPFKCSICGSGFHRKPHLTEHEESVHHICPVCATVFPDLIKLKEHSTTHVEKAATDNKDATEISCLECGREFKYKSALKRHLMFHTGERPHKCPVCKSGFSLLHDLKRHIKSHSKDRPFVCEICGKGFIGNNKLTRHQRSVHYVCRVCKSGFMSKKRLLDHVMTHKEEARSTKQPLGCSEVQKQS